MGKLPGHWWNLLIWTFVHFIRCEPPCNGINFPNKANCEATLYNKNLSLAPRPYVENDRPLYYQVKRLKGWNEYNRTLGRLVLCAYKDCQPSHLTSLRLTKNEYVKYPGTIYKETYHWSAIQINFTIPKPSEDHNYYTGAIKLTLSSDKDDTHGDHSFKEKHRLYDFSTYRYTSPDNDERVLQFPCFIGFLYNSCQTEDYKVYSLTLTAFSRKRTSSGLTPYTELTYNITVYGYYAYHPEPTVWKSTIATTLFPGNKDVTVVFDPAPDSVSVLKYNVALVDANTNVTLMSKLVYKNQPNHLRFADTEDGVYYILITTLCDDHQKCFKGSKYTRSHNFTVGNPYEITTTGVTDEGDTSLHLFLSVGGGVCLALILLGLIFYYHWRNHTTYDKTELQQLQKVLLIYSNITENNVTLAESFVKDCTKISHFEIVYDKLGNEAHKIEQEGYSSWYGEKIDESSSSIILWTPGSDNKPKGTLNTYRYNAFNIGVTLALNSKSNDNKKVVCVYFDKNHKITIPIDIQREAQVFRFPEESSRLFTFLRKQNQIQTKLDGLEPSSSEQFLAQNRGLFSENTETILLDDLGGRNSTPIIDNINPCCPIHGGMNNNVPTTPSQGKQYCQGAVPKGHGHWKTHLQNNWYHRVAQSEYQCCDHSDLIHSQFHVPDGYLYHEDIPVPTYNQHLKDLNNFRSGEENTDDFSCSSDIPYFESLNCPQRGGCVYSNRNDLSDGDEVGTPLNFPVSCFSDRNDRIPPDKIYRRVNSTDSETISLSSESIERGGFVYFNRNDFSDAEEEETPLKHQSFYFSERRITSTESEMISLSSESIDSFELKQAFQQYL